MKGDKQSLPLFTPLSNTDYHIPIMLDECLQALQINPTGTYVDLTFGGGGHSVAIATRLSTGKLYCFDQDKDAVENFGKIIDQHPNLKHKMVMINANFRFFKKYLRLYNVTHVDGVLADLGVSSHQFDEAGRGFSYRFDATLDMRMDTTQTLTAKQIVNEYSQEELNRIFKQYGEIENSWKLSETIVRQRSKKNINTTKELAEVCLPLAKKHNEYKYFSQVFQALRIEVNQELKALEEMLPQSADVLKKKGRLAIITFHSLEDRLVKNFIKNGKIEGEAEKDIFGNVNVPFKPVYKKPLLASDTEVQINKRARSAKLRVAEKI
jgi:16S rRNA (cytosine1402-N4)-methyltransferase